MYTVITWIEKMLLDFTLLGFSMAFMRQGITQIYLREKIVPNIEIWCINKIRPIKRVGRGGVTGPGLVFIGFIAKHTDMWAYCQVFFRFHSRKSYFLFWKNQKNWLTIFLLTAQTGANFFIASFISSREQFDVKHIISKYYL